MEITNYAPIIIPTLNRYEHFKRCLESLERCTGAGQTEVYVGVDFPPSEKYKEGWEKICQYLTEKEKNNGFKELHVIRRETNCGIGHPKSNGNLLINDIKQQHDTFIFTEDDNEFSPCFLEYMNQNLEKYKDDDSIYRICGYLPLNYSFSDEYSQFKADRHIAWGVGEWVSKHSRYSYLAQRENLHLLYEDKSLVRKFEEDKLENILFSLVKMSKGGPILGDVIVAVYLAYTNSRCILPTKSMVRNMGCDGSGQHSVLSSGYNEQEIQTSKEYILNEAPLEFTKEFEAEMHKLRAKRHRNASEWITVISWNLYKFLGIYCEFKFIHSLGKRVRNIIQCQKRIK